MADEETLGHTASALYSWGLARSLTSRMSESGDESSDRRGEWRKRERDGGMGLGQSIMIMML